MSDITMCGELYCSKAKSCRRHINSGTNPTKGKQAWQNFMRTDDTCDFHLPTLKEQTPPVQEK